AVHALVLHDALPILLAGDRAAPVARRRRVLAVEEGLRRPQASLSSATASRSIGGRPSARAVSRAWCRRSAALPASPGSAGARNIDRKPTRRNSSHPI